MLVVKWKKGLLEKIDNRIVSNVRITQKHVRKDVKRIFLGRMNLSMT